jgi:hypothetical protein
MLVPTRQDLAANLQAYGEPEASRRVSTMSQDEFDRMCKIGFELALKGEALARASCIAAIEVLEGSRRDLRRRRRSWSNVSPELLQPDPKFVAIKEWFDEYAGGEPLTKSQIFSGLAAALTPHLDGFRYFKSFRHFRAPFPDGTMYIGFDRGHGVVWLRFGVLHTGISNRTNALFGGPPLRAHLDRTISRFSANIGPRSRSWPYPTRPEWPIAGDEGLTRASLELVKFVEDVALPYVRTHRQIEAIHRTLLHDPGKADQVAPARDLFAAAHLVRRRDWLDEALAVLSERYRTYVPVCVPGRGVRSDVGIGA